MEAKIDQKLYTAFVQAFRAAGTQLRIDQLEALEGEVVKIGELIAEEARRQAVELVRRLQIPIAEGFDQIEQDIQALREQIAASADRTD